MISWHHLAVFCQPAAVIHTARHPDCLLGNSRQQMHGSRLLTQVATQLAAGRWAVRNVGLRCWQNPITQWRHHAERIASVQHSLLRCEWRHCRVCAFTWRWRHAVNAVISDVVDLRQRIWCRRQNAGNAWTIHCIGKLFTISEIKFWSTAAASMSTFQGSASQLQTPQKLT